MALSSTVPEEEESNGCEVQKADITARTDSSSLHHKLLSADQLSVPVWRSITCFLICTYVQDTDDVQDEARVLVAANLS